MQTKSNNANMLRVGTMLHGKYRIDSHLSSGGFGNTYVATHVGFREQVAIKEFFMKGVTQRDDNTSVVSVSNRDNVQQFEEQREKFRKEARRLWQMQNEHIVRVHDLFEENGTAYYVMDYVDGESLQERFTRTGQPMSENEVRRVLEQVLDALDTVHSKGIWHLDLKPANIMVDKQGVVKIIDFGASKQLNANKGGATTSTAVSYTNGFAPREQMEQNLDKFGPWTDFYALGATLYNLLSGKRPPLPSDIDDDESADKHIALPLLGAVSKEMRSLVLWLMQTNRIKRPQSVGEIRQRLSLPAAEEETVVAAPLQAKAVTQSAQQQQPKPKSTPPNNKMRIYILAATAVVAGTIMALSVGRGSCSGGQQAEAVNTVVVDSFVTDKYGNENKGRTYTINAVSFNMIAVDGGTFRMGSSSGDNDEKPVHSVTLSDYYIGQMEVTQALWTAVMGSNPSNWKGDNLPVERVSWNDCQEFIIKLNELTGERFRLPTEAEWEFAARGGNKSRDYIYSGSNEIEEVAWFYDNYDRKTHPVGTKAPNELGIYDMSGNVREWCLDWWGDYPSSAQTNPTGPTSGSFRVFRGGSWYDYATGCRPAFRGGNTPADANGDLGFRLAL